MATTYNDHLGAIDSVTNTNINTNGVGAITGAVHNLNEIAQNATMFANLVAYDNYNYKVVRTTDIPLDNGQALRDAYADAATFTGLSATNRFALLLPPGTYALGVTGLDVDTEFIDFVGLGQAGDVIITSTSNTNSSVGTITQTADDVRYKNLTLRNDGNGFTGASTDDSAYAPQSQFFNTILEDVILFQVDDPASSPVMAIDVEYAGTYTRCSIADPGSWAGSYSIFFGNATGKFTDCKAGLASGFGVNYDAAGTFIRCSSDSAGFGVNANASGVFEQCKIGGGGFASGLGYTADGTFTDCISVAGGSFGYLGNSRGNFYNCRAGASSFGGSATQAVYVNCVAEDFSFYGSDLRGSYSNCKAGNSSFNNSSLVELSGTFSNCIAGDSSFGTGTGVVLDGVFEFCSAGNNSFGYINPSSGDIGPILSGVFKSCSAGNNSFASSNDSDAICSVSGKFYNCTAGTFSFGRVAEFQNGTEFHNCVAGENSWRAWQLLGQSYGIYQNCTAGDASFDMRTRPEARFTNCTAGDKSFGAGVGNVFDLELAGTYINCHAGNESFGWGPLGGSQSVILSGRFENCTAGDTSFGWVSGNASGIDASGTFINCRAGIQSFVSKSVGSIGPDVFASGYFENCSAQDLSFAGHPNGKKTGTFVRCYCINSDADAGPLVGPTGYMQDCTWIAQGSGKNAIKIQDDDARIYGGIYIAGPTATQSIVTDPLATPYDAKIIGIKMNAPIDTAWITNLALTNSTDTAGNIEYTAL
jgi:hypothetical protein